MGKFPKQISAQQKGAKKNRELLVMGKYRARAFSYHYYDF